MQLRPVGSSRHHGKVRQNRPRPCSLPITLLHRSIEAAHVVWAKSRRLMRMDLAARLHPTIEGSRHRKPRLRPADFPRSQPLDSRYYLYKYMYMSRPRQYSVANARADLSHLIDRAARGEAVRITRRGRPVAVLVSVSEYERWENGRPSFLRAYEAFRQSVDDDDLVLDRNFFAGLRDTSPGRKTDL